MPQPFDLAPTLDEAAVEHLQQLRRQRRLITLEIAKLLGDRADYVDRPWWYCRRCGYYWQGMWPNRKPKRCSRCHTDYWDVEPSTPGARTPSDPPLPTWKTRRQERNQTRTLLHAPNSPPTISPENKAKAIASMNVARAARGLPPPPSLVEQLHRAIAQPRPEPQPEQVASRATVVSEPPPLPTPELAAEADLHEEEASSGPLDVA